MCNSMWNTSLYVLEAFQMGWKDHILTCGHTHVSGYQVLKDAASGLISHAIQVASFKIMDEHADKLGLDDKIYLMYQLQLLTLTMKMMIID